MQHHGVIASENIVSAPAAVNGVNFDGATSITLTSMASANSYNISFFGFFRMSNWSTAYSMIWGIAPETAQDPTALIVQNPAVKFNISDAAASLAKRLDFETSSPSQPFWTPPIGNNIWVPIIGTAFTNAGTGLKTLRLYFNDQDTIPNGTISDDDIAFQNVVNGKSFWMGDDSFGDTWTGDVCNFSLWPGVSFLTSGDISTTTRRLFYNTDFTSVAPSVAISALGTPAFMLTGGATTFASNSLGSEGPLTLNAGALSTVIGP